MTGKGALGGQMLPRRNATGDNIISNLLVNVLIERCLTTLFQIVVKHKFATWPYRIIQSGISLTLLLSLKLIISLYPAPL